MTLKSGDDTVLEREDGGGILISLLFHRNHGQQGIWNLIDGQGRCLFPTFCLDGKECFGFFAENDKINADGFCGINNVV